MPSRKLEIEIVGDHSSWSRATKGAIRDSDTLGSRLRSAAGIGAAALGGTLVTAAGAATYGIVKSTEAAEESNKVHEQTAAVLESTANAAHVSQKDVEGLSGAISRKTGIDDEEIQTGANLLLTFTNIRNEVGKGNDIFDQATGTIVDMGAALGQDAKSSAVQLGKALNDPIKGITALQRVGVSFSEDKAEQIKQWVEEGEVLRAQKAILRELSTEFGGSAEAQATAVDKIKVGVGNVEESIGNIFLPVIEDAATTLNTDYVPELQHTADALAAISDRNDIDLGEKLKLSGGVVSREWGEVPGEIGHFMDEAVPVVAEHAGDMGVAWAKGMLHGFVETDPLGKAAILLLASKAVGGPAALGGLIGTGKRWGSTLGGAAGPEGAAAMATSFGLSSRGTKVFGMIEKAKAAGKTVGKAGLAFGVLSGFSEAMATEEGGDAVQNFFHGLSYGALPASKGIGNSLADQLMEQWDDRLPEVQHHLKAGMSGALMLDRRRLATTLRIAIDTGASDERIDALREKVRGLDHEIDALNDAEEAVQQGARGLAAGKFTRLADIKEVVRRDIEAIRKTTQDGSQQARDSLTRNYRAAGKAIEIGMDRSVIKTKTGMAEIERLTRSAHLVSGDDPWGIAKGFSRTWERAGSITSQNINAITRDLGKMPSASAQITGQMMVEMARQMRQKGQLSKAEVEKLRSAVVTKLGAMAQQGGRKSDAFAGNVSGSFGVLSTQVADALANIGVNVSTVLKELGAHNPDLQFTLDYIGAHGGKGSGKKYMDQVGPLPGAARGGPLRVPGDGLHDTVPVAVNGALSAVVAPGEDLVVLNRHQRPMVDEALALRWGVNGLPGFFSAYDRPHHMAKGGLHEPKLQGPDPLRALGQAGIHKGFSAAQDYLRAHRPKPSAGGVAGYTGPPANMKQLGDNAWVDSHTAAVAAFLVKKFGVQITDGWRPQNASYGAANSSHKRGTPANPGAFDFAPPSTALQAFAGSHIAGLTENDIHDWGTGLHNHIAFFNRGGVFRGPHPGDNRKPSRIYHDYHRFAKWAHRHDRDKGDGVGWTGVLYDYAENQGVDVNRLKYLHGSAGLPSQWYEKWYAGKMFAGGGVITGKVSYFNGPSSTTASGIPVARPGLALNLNPGTDSGWDNETTRGWMAAAADGHPVYGRTTIAGHSANLPIIDLGPSGFTGRAIDVTEGGVRKLGLDPASFPTDSIGKVEILGGGTGSAGGKKAQEARQKAEKALAIGGGKAVQVPALGSSPLLPGAKSLPKNIQGLLTAPGLDYAGRYGISERAVEQAEGTVGVTDDLHAIEFQEDLLRRRREGLQSRLKEANAGLRKADSPEHRKALLSRREHILEELGGVQSGLAADRERSRELRPTEADRADLQLARAESTADKGDDVVALKALEDLAKKELARAEHSGDPREIAEATRNLTQATEALREVTPTAEDFANRDLALAELTEGIEDDKSALEKLLSISEAELAAALATSDPRDDIDAAHKVKQIRDSLESLVASAENGDLAQETKALREELEKNRKLSESEAAVSAAVARRALADIISNELGQRVSHSAQTAGDGTLGVL